jgi:hypothetical protein
VCVVTVHALLHIADSIEISGPVWASWAFPMERYCGLLLPAAKSRRFPFSSIDRYVTELAQLTQIKTYHRLHNSLSFQPPKSGVAGQFSDPSCKYLFIFRRHLVLTLSLQIQPAYYFPHASLTPSHPRWQIKLPSLSQPDLILRLLKFGHI